MSGKHTPRGPRRPNVTQPQTAVAPAELARLVAGEHTEPHALLGAHPADGGVVVRALHPDAVSADCVLADGTAVAMEPLGAGGVFAGYLEGRETPLRYRVRFHFQDGTVWERDDPYRFWPTVGELDEHLFAEGTHRRLWECLGAHAREMDGVPGTAFAVWAPSARRVSVVGDFCGWDGRLYPMRQLGVSGIFELFVPGVAAGRPDKDEIKTHAAALRVKTDPLAAGA